jgi:uncharacterized membrane protein
MDIITYFKVLLLLIMLDIPFLFFINNKMYKKQFERIQGDSVVPFIRLVVSAVITYLVLAFAIQYFAINTGLVINGFILGFCIYSVYNFTNLATISQWGYWEAIADTIWGTVLCGIITKTLIKS